MIIIQRWEENCSIHLGERMSGTAAGGEICVEFISGSNLRAACSINRTAKMPHLCPARCVNQRERSCRCLPTAVFPRFSATRPRGVGPVTADAQMWRRRWEVSDLSLCSKSFQVWPNGRWRSLFRPVPHKAAGRVCVCVCVVMKVFWFRYDSRCGSV